MSNEIPRLFGCVRLYSAVFAKAKTKASTARIRIFLIAYSRNVKVVECESMFRNLNPNANKQGRAKTTNHLNVQNSEKMNVNSSVT